MNDQATIIKCKFCRHRSDCAICPGDDWFCGDAEPLTNGANDTDKAYDIFDEILKGLKDYCQKQATSDHYIPEECVHCANHPSNGGNGICHCVLGAGFR